MKRFNRIITYVLCVIFCCTFFVGCATNSSGTSGKLAIRIVNTGYGVDFLYDIAEEFERLYDCAVDISESVEPDQELSKYGADYEMDDLFFCTGTNGVWNLITQKKFVEIDDVWDATCEDEEVKIKDKTLSFYRDYSYVYDGHYYSLPINIGLGGFVYNKTSMDKIFGAGNYTLPNTSNELYNIALAVKNKGHWAFSWTTKIGYWGCATNVWEHQYNGLDVQEHYNKGEYYDSETGIWKFSKNAEVFSQNVGALKRLEALDKLVDKSQGLSSKYCADMDFMQSQMSFSGLGFLPADDKLVAFAPNGAWLWKENYEDFQQSNSEIGIFSTVMSACVEKLSFWSEEEGVGFYDLTDEKQAKYDKVLSTIINYVKGGMKGSLPNSIEGYTVLEEDVVAVKDMMAIRQIDFQANAVIPKTAKNIDLAKEFLKFYCSDYASEIYIEGAKSFSPFLYTGIDESIISGLSLFERDVYNMLQGGVKVAPSGGEGFPLTYAYRIDGAEWFDRTQADMVGKRTPSEILNTLYINYNTKNWHSFCAQANVSYKLNG